MKLEDIQAFLKDVEALPMAEKAMAKQMFFNKHIKADPQWHDLPPQARFEFARSFGIDVGVAQQFPGEAFVRGGKPVTGEFGEGPFETGFLPMPQGSLGEVGRLGEDLNNVTGVADLAYRSVPFAGLAMQALPGIEQADLGSSRYAPGLMEALGDPVQALQGGGVAALGRTPWVGKWLQTAIQNPLIRQQLTQGVLSSILDNQFLGMQRLPGWAARKTGNFLQRFRQGPGSVTPPSTYSTPRPLPAGPTMKALPAKTPEATGPFPMPGATKAPEPPSGPFPFVR